MTAAEYGMMRQLFQEERKRRITNPTHWDIVKKQLTDKLNTLYPFDDALNHKSASIMLDTFFEIQRSNPDTLKNAETFLSEMMGSIQYALEKNKQTHDLDTTVLALAEILRQGFVNGNVMDEEKEAGFKNKH